MARTTLYSRSPRRAAAAQAGPSTPTYAAQAGDTAPDPQADAAVASTAQAKTTPAANGWRASLLRHERWAWAIGALLLAAVAGWPSWQRQVTQPYSLEQIDAALRESLVKEPLPAVTAAAYEAILPSVVRVVGLPAEGPGAGNAGPAAKAKPNAGPNSGQNGATGPKTPRQPRASDPAGAEEDEPLGQGRSVGTGVVIVNSGLILTNLHVVQGAGRIKVTFFDGSESEATVVSTQPENDLAVLQARVLPDDLHAATLRSTQGLTPGDTVVAVGFPFGIGPSASAGVVSGLKREFRSPKGQRILTNLIQFDAAANPGNSGGPLVTQDGSVVGIVTAIMNPEGHSTFIGIGFAVPIENAAAAVGMPPF